MKTLQLAILQLAVFLSAANAGADDDQLFNAAELRDAYLTEKIGGTRKVSDSLIGELRTFLKAEMERGNLEGANLLNSLIQKIGKDLESLESGESLTFSFIDPEAAPLPDEFAALVSSHQEWLDRGFEQLRMKHLAGMRSSQKRHLASADLTEANLIQKQIEQLEGLSTDSTAGPDQKPIDFLAEEYRDQWKDEKGSWTFRGNRLIGEGDSRIGFHAPLQPPFVLSWRHEVKEGQRPRVYVENFTIANFGYDFEICLQPKLDGQKTFAYKRDRAVDVEFVVDREFVELWIEGEQYDRRVAAMPQTVSAVYFSGGDSWSPGITQFSNIKVTPGGRED